MITNILIFVCVFSVLGFLGEGVSKLASIKSTHVFQWIFVLSFALFGVLAFVIKEYMLVFFLIASVSFIAFCVFRFAEWSHESNRR